MRMRSVGLCALLACLQLSIAFECPPGWGVRNKTESDYFECERCKHGTWSSSEWHRLACKPCTKCSPSEVVSRKCTKISDTICRPRHVMKNDDGVEIDKVIVTIADETKDGEKPLELGAEDQKYFEKLFKDVEQLERKLNKDGDLEIVVDVDEEVDSDEQDVTENEEALQRHHTRGGHHKVTHDKNATSEAKEHHQDHNRRQPHVPVHSEHNEVRTFVLAGLLCIVTACMIAIVAWLIVYKRRVFMVAPHYHQFARLDSQESELIRASAERLQQLELRREKERVKKMGTAVRVEENPLEAYLENEEKVYGDTVHNAKT